MQVAAGYPYAAISQAVSYAERTGCQCGLRAAGDPSWVTSPRQLASCDALGLVELAGQVVGDGRWYRTGRAKLVSVWATQDTDRVSAAAIASGIAFEGRATGTHTELAQRLRAKTI
jgi:hypothetical protein